MIALGLTLIGLGLLISVLVCGWRSNLLERYPLFYTYISLQLFSALILWPVYFFFHKDYSTVYWPIELITRTADYALLVEIARNIFKTNPIIRRVVSAIAIGLFTMIFGLYIVPPVLGSYTYDVAIHSLGGRLAASVGTLLIFLLAMARYYRISLHNNLKFICLGLGILTSFRIANNMLASHMGSTYLPTLRLLDSVGWTICLGAWAVGLRQVTYPLQVSSSGGLDLNSLIGKIGNLNNDIKRLFW